MELPQSSVDRVVADLCDAELGDPRRTARLQRVASKLAECPQRSLPDAMGSEAELEGAYRLINNPRVSMEALDAAHARQTASRAVREGVVLAIHDTTPCQFSHADPAAVGYLNTGKPGFNLHYSLVVGADSRRPLGTSYVEPIFRSKPPRRRNSRSKQQESLSGAQTHKKPNREFERWRRGMAATETCLDGCEVIHIADRESDSYPLMAQSVQNQRRFVFRARIGERSAQLANGASGSVQQLAADTQGVLTREVALATRKRRSTLSSAHPPRKARLASLRFSATPVEIFRPRYVSAGEFPRTLRLHVVRVWEPHPPHGEAPVQWLLFTTEPIDTPEQVAAIVDMYRARWLIEECNKALKSGCMVEQRQFESREALLTMLAISLPIACEILRLRAATRENPERPGTDVASPLQIDILRRLGSRTLSPTPTAREVLLAVAAMGGHQRSNGQPGWLVLQRGMSKLLAYETGWRAARQAPDDL